MMDMSMQMQQETSKQQIKCCNCRFWSERLARAIGGGPTEAYCLVEGGPLSGRYTTGIQGCDKGKPNQHGAVDDPYEDYGEVLRLYAEDDAAEQTACAYQKHGGCTCVGHGECNFCKER